MPHLHHVGKFKRIAKTSSYSDLKASKSLERLKAFHTLGTKRHLSLSNRSIQ